MKDLLEALNPWRRGIERTEEGLVLRLGDKVGVDRRCFFDNGRQEARDLIDVSSLQAPSANVPFPTAFLSIPHPR